MHIWCVPNTHLVAACLVRTKHAPTPHLHICNRAKHAPSRCVFGAYQIRTWQVHIWCAPNTHLTFIYIFATAPNTHLPLLKLCLNSEGKRTNNAPTQRTNVLSALRTKYAPAHRNDCQCRQSWTNSLCDGENQLLFQLMFQLTTGKDARGLVVLNKINMDWTAHLWWGILSIQGRQ